MRDHKKSLFAAGILKITGEFAAQDAVVLCDSNGYEFARGLCNYTLKEVQKVQVRLCCVKGHQHKSSLTCVAACPFNQQGLQRQAADRMYRRVGKRQVDHAFTNAPTRITNPPGRAFFDSEVDGRPLSKKPLPAGWCFLLMRLSKHG